MSAPPAPAPARAPARSRYGSYLRAHVRTLWDLPFVTFPHMKRNLNSDNRRNISVWFMLKIDRFRNISNYRNLFRDGQSPHCILRVFITSYRVNSTNVVCICEPELYITYYVTYRCLRRLESDCTRLCKYIHIVVKCRPRQYEKERCELRQVSMLPAIFLLGRPPSPLCRLLLERVCC